MAQDFRHVALTWRQVLAILFIFPTGICLLASTAVYDGRPETVHATRVEFAVAGIGCALISAGLFTWNHYISSQPDVHPDILAQLFGDKSVFEMDSLHFWAAGHQRGGVARVLILLQNVYGAECTGRLQLNPVGTTTKMPKANAPLEFKLDNAEVLACWRDLPVPVTAVRSDSAATAMTVFALASGHIHVSGGSRLNIKLESPPPDALEKIAPGAWETISLWSLQDQRNPDDVKKLIDHLWIGAN